MKSEKQLKKKLELSKREHDKIRSEYIKEIVGCLDNWMSGMVFPNPPQFLLVLNIEINLLEWIQQMLLFQRIMRYQLCKI